MLCFTMYAMRVRVVACMCAMSRCELTARHFLLTRGQHLPAKQDNKILSMNSSMVIRIHVHCMYLHLILYILCSNISKHITLAHCTPHFANPSSFEGPNPAITPTLIRIVCLYHSESRAKACRMRAACMHTYCVRGT